MVITSFASPIFCFLDSGVSVDIVIVFSNVTYSDEGAGLAGIVILLFGICVEIRNGDGDEFDIFDILSRDTSIDEGSLPSTIVS